MASFGIRDKGYVRKINQDYFYCGENGKYSIGIVCDGVGGNKAGEVASQLGCKVIEDEFNEITGNVNAEKWLEKVVEIANLQILTIGQSDDRFTGMSTTVVGYFDNGEKTAVVNVGDSRCYKVVDGVLIQVSEDHTVLNELVKYRGFDYSVASKMVGKNVISRALGVYDEVGIDTFIVDDYQYLLLCSDGLHGYVSESIIQEVLNSSLTLKQKAEKLVSLANEAGGFDNITVVIYQR